MRIVCMVLLLIVAAACAEPPKSAEPASKPKFETRWLRGLSATDVKNVAQARGLACQGPTREGGTNVWSCASATPLVGYTVRFYGSAPLKLEYVTATITQSGVPKTDLVAPLFVALGGLHFEGCDTTQARAWVRKAIDAPGETTFGPAKFKVSGDPTKLTLDIKASGADW